MWSGSRAGRVAMALAAGLRCALILVGGAGCFNPFDRKGPAATQPWTTVGGEEKNALDPAGLGPANPDGAPRRVWGVEVKVYGVIIPRGAVSANESFWKRVDENAVDLAKYDRLFKNGIRVGVGRQEDWEYFKDLLARYPAKHQLNAVTLFDEQVIDVPVKKGIERQVLSYFGPDGDLELKTYENCDNVLQFGFVPAPRRAESARIALTPVVRSAREKLEIDQKGDEIKMKFVAAERMYDLSLAVEVPFGQFLVISPSSDVARQTSIGRNFLLVDGEAEQSEFVILIVPLKAEAKESKVAGEPAAK